MPIPRPGSTIAAVVIGFFLCAAVTYADTAQVLPKGVYQFDATVFDYRDITERFDPDGDKEPLAIDFNGPLDSTVFPALAPLDPLVPGNATIGDAVAEFTFDYKTAEFNLNYGVTDRVSVGVKIPYFDAKNKVDATLDTATANVGINPAFPAVGPPLIPIAAGGVPLTDEDVQALLGPGLDVNGDGTVEVPGFGFERFETWSGSGVGDIEVGAKYKFRDRDNWRLAFAGGVRLPTGDEDDPDDLVDLAFGTGQTGVLFRFYADYTGIKNTLLNVTFFYDILLSDKETRRVPSDVNEPITRNRERVDRNLGDVYQVELAAVYSFTPQWFGGLEYRYSKKGKDDIDGDLGFNYESLEDETDRTSQIVRVNVGYSTLKLYQDKKARVPWYGALEYRKRFDGENNVNVSEYVALIVGFFFK